MLYESIKKVKFNSNQNKILFLSTALDDSFVLACRDQDQTQYLIHYSKQSHELFKRSLQEGHKVYGMITTFNAVILQASKNRITLISLIDHSSFSFQHHFQFSESDDKEMQIFSETGLLCIKQNGNYNQNRLKLTYYSYPFHLNTKITAAYQSKEKQWQYDYMLKKGDNKSLIIWFNTRHWNLLQFQTFHLSNVLQGRYNKYKIQDPTFEPLKMHRQMAMTYIWQSKSEQFLAIYSSGVDYDQNPCQKIVQIKLKDSSLKIIAKSFEIDSYVMSILNLGSYSLLYFYKFCRLENRPKYHTIYLDHEKLSIISQKIQLDPVQNGSLLGFDNSTYISASVDPQNSQDIILKLTKIMRPKEVMLHFMLHINDNFDDDLLQDALQLLDVI